MEIFSIIASSLLGTIIGSFLNVVVYRTHRGLDLGGRSVCTYCHKQIPNRFLVPVLGYFLSHGKCFSCKEKISSQYVWGEALLGIIFASITAITLYQQGIGSHIILPLLYWFIMTSLLFLISYYDYLYQLILPIPLYSAIVISVIYGLVFGQITLLSMVVGMGVSIPFLVLYIYSQGAWFGFGDLELMFLTGVNFGFIKGIGSIVLAFWIATVVMIIIGIYFMLKNKKIHSWNTIKKIKIPFGPFLCISFLLTGLFHLDVIWTFSLWIGNLLFY